MIIELTDHERQHLVSLLGGALTKRKLGEGFRGLDALRLREKLEERGGNAPLASHQGMHE